MLDCVTLWFHGKSRADSESLRAVANPNGGSRKKPGRSGPRHSSRLFHNIDLRRPIAPKSQFDPMKVQISLVESGEPERLYRVTCHEQFWRTEALKKAQQASDLLKGAAGKKMAFVQAHNSLQMGAHSFTDVLVVAFAQQGTEC